jgi:tetratricopeptide (TPR) repeat protein
VARGAAQARRRAKAEGRKRQANRPPPTLEQTMFFPRLRRQAKWMFLFLALVFGVGFVVFGVGSGSTGIADVLRGIYDIGGSSGGTSVGKAQDKVEKEPKNAQAWLDLATAYSQKNRTDDQIAALERYMQLRPRDADTLAQLSAFYRGRADDEYIKAQDAQAEAQIQAPAPLFALDPASKIAQSFQQDPITRHFQQTASDSLQKASTYYKQAISAYTRLAKLTPDDQLAQFQLGETARLSFSITNSPQDKAAAIAAYTRAIKVAPESATATEAKQARSLLQLGFATNPTG